MKIILLILGMTVVTYVPRLLPAAAMDRIEFPTWFEKWLRSIPYAALGALIFPGIILVQEDQPLIGVVGGIVALVLSVLRVHVTLVMVGSIFSVLLLQNFI